MGAENPHTLRNGALNDGIEAENDYLQNSQLTTKYNALDLRYRKPQNCILPSSAQFPKSNKLVSSYVEHSLTSRDEERMDQENEVDENCQGSMPVYCGFQQQDLLPAKYTKQRNIAKNPFKVLDAPCLTDDFYLNHVDWSAQNVLAVGLGSCVYLWHASTSKVAKLSDIGPNNRVTSCQWSRDGQLFAVGTHTGELQIWDTTK